MGSAIQFPGLAARIAERLRELGYVKSDRLDVTRFCLDHRYMPAYLYQWLKGSTPTYGYLERLAEDLRCEVGWLLLGDARFSPDAPARVLGRVTKTGRWAKPISGGSDAVLPRWLGALGAQAVSYQTLARRWWRAARDGVTVSISPLDALAPA